MSKTSVDEKASMTSETFPEIRFTRSLPGFPGLTRFALVRPGNLESAPDTLEEPILYELRSLENADARFLVAVPGAFFSDYEIELDDALCDELGLTAPEDALVLAVLTMGGADVGTTANLRAPIVINVRTRIAAQIILADAAWPVRAVLAAA